MTVNFDVETDPNVDQDPDVAALLAGRIAAARRRAQSRRHGAKGHLVAVPVRLGVFAQGNAQRPFLANYAYINIVRRVDPGERHRPSQRLRRRPVRHAHLGQTRPAGQAQHHRPGNCQRDQQSEYRQPRRPSAATPAPPGQEFTITVVAQGRLVTAEQFGQIVVRANPDGSIVRLKDVARIELGGQDYDIIGRYNGQAAANMSLYQLPGSNALDAAKEVKRRLEELKKRFPADIDYDIALDTTQAITEGMREIMFTFLAALAPGHARGLRVPARLARDADSVAGGAGFADRAPSLSFRCSASPSTPCRSSAWCWPSDWSWTTPLSSSSAWSATWRRDWRPRRRRSRRWGRFPGRSWPSRSFWRRYLCRPFSFRALPAASTSNSPSPSPFPSSFPPSTP